MPIILSFHTFGCPPIQFLSISLLAAPEKSGPVFISKAAVPDISVSLQITVNCLQSWRRIIMRGL